MSIRCFGFGRGRGRSGEDVGTTYIMIPSPFSAIAMMNVLVLECRHNGVEQHYTRSRCRCTF